MRTFLRFWYDFIVGDDWTIAVGVVLALVATALLAHNGLNTVWWLLPLVVGVGLTWSVLRAARRARPALGSTEADGALEGRPDGVA